MGGDVFVPILAGLGQKAARPALDRWLHQQHLAVEDIGLDNLRLDLGRANDGKDFWRWRIREEVLVRLGLPALM